MSASQQSPTSFQEVHITSLVVHTLPEHVQTVSTDLCDLPGVEIHRAEDNGKLIVLMETSNLMDVTARVDAMRSLAGVVNVTLVYHQIEDGALLGEPIDASPLTA